MKHKTSFVTPVVPICMLQATADSALNNDFPPAPTGCCSSVLLRERHCSIDQFY